MAMNQIPDHSATTVVLYLRVSKELKDALAACAVADHERRRQLAGGWTRRETTAEYSIGVLAAHAREQARRARGDTYDQAQKRKPARVRKAGAK